jgi:hypothetical protein
MCGFRPHCSVKDEKKCQRSYVYNQFVERGRFCRVAISTRVGVKQKYPTERYFDEDGLVSNQVPDWPEDGRKACRTTLRGMYLLHPHRWWFNRRHVIISQCAAHRPSQCIFKFAYIRWSYIWTFTKGNPQVVSFRWMICNFGRVGVGAVRRGKTLPCG